ncbi:MAG: hypothetical protein J6R36_04920 [Bacteroidaceae bacterium]|nr:hypothetical protein [Bacteroidaceae bacterium]
MYEKFMAEHFGNLHHKGFKYIARLCELYEKENQKITGLYYKIAKEFNSSYASVERCLRVYVEDIPEWNLPVRINKMTPGEVVPAIVYCVKRENKQSPEELALSLTYDLKCVGCQYEKACHGTCHHEDCADFNRAYDKLLEAFGKLNGGA